ncbi:MAG: hypothetical protein H6841_01515 [Planctomycetes bacterium]|nr:hypothetical protein [Planctomycetota bacterium]MCB9935609.1 hypothetical protein [Planctomycetota bacterium]
MIKLLNILLAVSLAAAPGLSVNGLLHSLSLCDLLAPQSSHMRPAARHCGHDHQQPQPEDEPTDCHHVDGVAQAVIAPALSLALEYQSLPPQVCLVGTDMLQPPVLLPALPKDPRPPPGEPRTGTTLILI